MKALCSHGSALQQGYFLGFPGMPSARGATNTEQKKATTLFLTPVVWGATTSAALAAMPRPCCQRRQGYLKGWFREETQIPVALVQV